MPGFCTPSASLAGPGRVGGGSGSVRAQSTGGVRLWLEQGLEVLSQYPHLALVGGPGLADASSSKATPRVVPGRPCIVNDRSLFGSISVQPKYNFSKHVPLPRLSRSKHII